MRATATGELEAILPLLNSAAVDVRRHAVIAIGRQRLVHGVPALATQLGLEQEEMRVAIAGVLVALASPAARDAFVAALADSSKAVRQLAVNGLAILNDPAAVDAAVDLYCSGTDRATRSAALSALIKVKDSRADAALEHIAVTELSWWWRRRLRAARRARGRESQMKI